MPWDSVSPLGLQKVHSLDQGSKGVDSPSASAALRLSDLAPELQFLENGDKSYYQGDWKSEMRDVKGLVSQTHGLSATLVSCLSSAPSSFRFCFVLFSLGKTCLSDLSACFRNWEAESRIWLFWHQADTGPQAVNFSDLSKLCLNSTGELFF